MEPPQDDEAAARFLRERRRSCSAPGAPCQARGRLVERAGAPRLDGHGRARSRPLERTRARRALAVRAPARMGGKSRPAAARPVRPIRPKPPHGWRGCRRGTEGARASAAMPLPRSHFVRAGRDRPICDREAGRDRQDDRLSRPASLWARRRWPRMDIDLTRPCSAIEREGAKLFPTRASARRRS